MAMLGVVELVIVLMMLLISLTIPTAVLVFAVLIYRKLGRIEEALSHRDE